MLNNKLDELFELQARFISCSLDTLKWSCLYSGLGIISPLSKKIVDLLASMDPNAPSGNYCLENYAPVCCIYKSGVPAFAVPSKEILNPGRYMWDDRYHKRSIEIETQAYAIVSLSIASTAISSCNKLEASMMIKTAKQIYDFTSSHLRNDDGLYVNGLDKSKITDQNKTIKLDEKSTQLSNQLLMLEATAALNEILHDAPPDVSGNHTSLDNLKLELANMTEYILGITERLLDQTSRQLSASISSLSRTIILCKHQETKRKLLEPLFALSAELATRVRLTGEVEKSCDNETPASLSTHFKSCAALLDAYHLTGIKHFLQASFNIHDNLMDLYDPDLGLFHDCHSNDIDYSISDFADTLKVLFLHYKLTNDQHSLKLFKEIFHSYFETTLLLQSVSSRVIQPVTTSSGTQAFSNISHPLMEEVGIAPVFMKSVKLKLSKPNDPVISKRFSSRHALYAALLFLYELDRV